MVAISTKMLIPSNTTSAGSGTIRVSALNKIDFDFNHFINYTARKERVASDVVVLAVFGVQINSAEGFCPEIFEVSLTNNKNETPRN